MWRYLVLLNQNTFLQEIDTIDSSCTGCTQDYEKVFWDIFGSTESWNGFPVPIRISITRNNQAELWCKHSLGDLLDFYWWRRFRAETSPWVSHQAFQDSNTRILVASSGFSRSPHLIWVYFPHVSGTRQ